MMQVPLLITDAVRRWLRPVFVGTGGIAVHDHGQTVTIDASGLRSVSIAGGAARSVEPFRWAVVTEIKTSVVGAKLLDGDGVPTGDQFDVHLYGGNEGVVTLTPDVDSLTPHLVVGSYLRIVQAPAPGETDPVWWSIDTFVETCL